MLSPSKVSIADKRVPQGFPDAARIAQSTRHDLHTRSNAATIVIAGPLEPK
jgi:hypothetical protein